MKFVDATRWQPHPKFTDSFNLNLFGVLVLSVTRHGNALDPANQFWVASIDKTRLGGTFETREAASEAAIEAATDQLKTCLRALKEAAPGADTTAEDFRFSRGKIIEDMV